MTLALEVMTRGLALVRFLYEMGVQQSRQSGIRRATCLLAFHDAVEMFLVLGLQHHDAYSTRRLYHFDEYWSELEKKGVHMTQHGTMQALNRARVGLKHHAVLPAPGIAEDARVHARDFFIENTAIVFGANFDEIALSSLVASEKVRARLAQAEKHLTANECDPAIGEIAYAFHVLLREEEASRARRTSRGFRLRPLLLPLTFVGLQASGGLGPFGGLGHLSDYADQPISREMAQLTQAVSESLHDLQLAVRVLGLGLDFNRWQRFLEIAPTVVDLRGTDELGRTEWHRDEPPTHEECRFCLDFVVDSALRLQEAETQEAGVNPPGP